MITSSNKSSVNRTANSSWTRKFWRRVLVLGLLLLGAALRLAMLGQVPPGLYHDEAQHGLDALSVLSGNFPLYFPANNGREPLFIYGVSAFVAVLGRNPLAVRWPSFFVGFLTLAATYDLARRLWGNRVGRWALAVLSITLWHVHLSRVGFRAVLLPLFIALWLGQAVRAWQSTTACVRSQAKSRPWASSVAAGLLYGLSWYTYIAARFTPVALAFLGGYIGLTHISRSRRLVNRQDRKLRVSPGRRLYGRSLLIFCAAALIVLTPLGIYTLLHPDVVLTRTGQVSVFSPVIHEGDLGGTLFRHTLRALGMFFVRGDRIWRHNLAFRPVWGPALGLAFVIGVGVMLQRAFSQRLDLTRPATIGAGLTVCWTLTMLVPTILAEDAPHFLRGVGVLPLAVFFPALGLAFLETAFKRFLGSIRSPTVKNLGVRFTFRILPIILFLLGLYSTVDAYFFRYAHTAAVYHWFESGPVALAGRINALLERGWNGRRMVTARMITAPHSREGAPQEPPRSLNERQIYMDRTLWDAWTAIPFLVPETAVDFLPLGGAFPDPDRGMAFVVWPYRAWQPSVLPYLTHPAYLSLAVGPQTQGDLDPEPYTIAMIARREPLANVTVPDPIARFERGIVLHAALVRDNSARSPDREALRVRLWWGTSARLTEPYTVFVHYLRDGERIAQDDGQPGHGHLPTTSWRPGDLIMDEHDLPLPHGDPLVERGLRPMPHFVPDPARDTLRVGMYHGDTLEGLSWLDSAGNPAGAWFDWPVILSE